MYYPKSQIKTNLYTNGELVTPNNSPYVGYYYELSNGKRYTGKTPQDGPNFELTHPSTSVTPETEENVKYTPTYNNVEGPIVPTNIDEDLIDISLVQNYQRINNIKDIEVKKLPSPHTPHPTSQDYEIGEFERYFCKKTNELIYREISKDDYEKLFSQDDTIAWDLYTPIRLPWQLKGDKQTVYNVNKSSVERIERNFKFYGFTKYFKGKFLKYYLST